MINFDFWYGNKLEDVEKIDVFYYPNAGEYRGNIYKAGRIIGDYVSNDSVQLETVFPGIFGK